MKVVLAEGKLFLMLVFLSLVASLFDLRGWLSVPKTLLQSFINPIQIGLYQSAKSINRQWQLIISARTASQEKEALLQQLAAVLAENAKLRKQLAEAQALIAQDKALSFQTYHMVAAHPIGSNRYLKIDRGSNDGIKTGQAVVFKENLLGEIYRVEPKQAEVRLIFDPDFKVSAFVQNDQGRAKGILMGQFGSQIVLDKILQEEPVMVNDIVYSDGLEGGIPRGLILGKITSVKQAENQVFKTAEVKPVFDMTDMDLVFVIIE